MILVHSGRELTNKNQKNGAEKAFNPLENLNESEKTLLKAAVEGLKGNISKGVTFAYSTPQK